MLSQRLFGDASLRTSKDLDVFVHPDDLARADQLLLANDCQRSVPATPLTARQWRVYLQEGHHFSYTLPPHKIPLELHWAIDSANLIPPSISQEMVIQAQPVPPSGSGLFTLAARDLPLYLLIHGARHRWVRLKWLVDLVVWMRGATAQDWQQWIQNVETLGLQRALGQGITLSNWLFPSPVPEATRLFNNGLPAGERLAQVALKSILDVDYTGGEVGKMERLQHLLYMMKLKTGMRFKWTTLNRIWVSPEDWQDLPLPDRLFPFYRLLRPILWLWRNHLRPRHKQEESGL